MKTKFILTILFLQLFYIGYSQNEQYKGLELAKTLAKGQVYFFEILSEDYAIIASFHDMYVINSSYIMVDTVNEVSGQRNTNPISSINILDATHFTVSTMMDMYLFKLNNGKAILIKEMAYDRKFEQFKAKHHSRTLTQYGYLGEYFPMRGKTTEFLYSDSSNNYGNGQILYKGVHDKLEKDFGIIYYENRLKDFYEGKILMNDICTGITILYDERLSRLTTILLPEIDGTTFRYIMYDRLDRKYYLIAKTNELNSFIFPFNIETAKTTAPRIVIEKDIRAITGGRAFYRKRMDDGGLVGYYYTPLKEKGLGFGSIIEEVFVESIENK